MKRMALRHSSDEIDFDFEDKAKSFSPEEIINLFPRFDKEVFSFPEKIEYMDFEKVEVGTENLFIMPEIKIVDKTVVNSKTGEETSYESNDPKIACKSKLSLDLQNTVVLLGMRDSFSFISEILFQINHGLTKRDSDRVLSVILIKIMEETGWTHSQSLFSILIRDVITPTIILASTNDSLHDTVRFFYTEKGSCRWALVPYHSPSLTFGEFITPGHEDFPDKDLSNFEDI